MKLRVLLFYVSHQTIFVLSDLVDNVLFELSTTCAAVEDGLLRPEALKLLLFLLHDLDHLLQGLKVMFSVGAEEGAVRTYLNAVSEADDLLLLFMSRTKTTLKP